MIEMLQRAWWVFLIRGIAAIVFGVLAFAMPGLTLVTLVLLFAAYAFVDGVSLLVSLIRGEPAARRNGLAIAIMGVLGVVAGILALVWPGLTALSLLYVVAMWSIATGVFQILAAIRLRREIEGELWMALGGVVAVLFGLYLAVFPGSGLLSLVWLVGIWSVVFGISNVVLGLRLGRRSSGMSSAAA
jgi:uncharacterized membrane protein HdeD (DUF308 family)